MKVTIEKDDGVVEVFQNVTDCYLAVRQETVVMKDGAPVQVLDTRSYSWGSNLRALASELYQSWLELQDVLRKLRKGAN